MNTRNLKWIMEPDFVVDDYNNPTSLTYIFKPEGFITKSSLEFHINTESGKVDHVSFYGGTKEDNVIIFPNPDILMDNGIVEQDYKNFLQIRDDELEYKILKNKSL